MKQECTRGKGVPSSSFMSKGTSIVHLFQLPALPLKPRQLQIASWNRSILAGGGYSAHACQFATTCWQQIAFIVKIKQERIINVHEINRPRLEVGEYHILLAQLEVHSEKTNILEIKIYLSVSILFPQPKGTEVQNWITQLESVFVDLRFKSWFFFFKSFSSRFIMLLRATPYRYEVPKHLL